MSCIKIIPSRHLPMLNVVSVFISVKTDTLPTGRIYLTQVFLRG